MRTAEEKEKLAMEFEEEMLGTLRSILEAVNKGGYKAPDDADPAATVTALALLSAIVAQKIGMPKEFLWDRICQNVWRMAQEQFAEIRAATDNLTIH